jgi:hypothetical protein
VAFIEDLALDGSEEPHSGVPNVVCHREDRGGLDGLSRIWQAHVAVLTSSVSSR